MEQAWLSIISKGLRMIALAGVFMNGNMSAMRQMHSEAGQSASSLSNDTAERTPARDTRSAGGRHGRQATNSPCTGADSSGSPGLVRLTDGVHLLRAPGNGKEKTPTCFQSGDSYLKLDDDALSHGEAAHCHRRCIVSLLSSEWDQVVPMLYGRQAIRLLRGC